MVIEVDGSIHLTEKQKRHDKVRDDFLRSNGFTVLRFTNEEVLSNVSECIERIKSVPILSRREASRCLPRANGKRENALRGIS